MILRTRLPNDLLRSYCPTVPLLYASRLWESNLLAAPAPAVEAVSDGTHKNRLAWRAAALIGIWLQYQVAKSWCGIHYLSSNPHVQCREKLKFIFLACSRRVLQIPSSPVVLFGHLPSIGMTHPFWIVHVMIMQQTYPPHRSKTSYLHIRTFLAI